METIQAGLTYADAGVEVRHEGDAMTGLLGWVRKSFALRSGIGKVAYDLGQFANVVDIGGGLGLAVSADGVGTKIMVAEMLGRFDTVGIDCVAMNANDLVCVGAEPISFLNYIAVEKLDGTQLEAIGRGLYEGARQAGVTIPGGEVAQLPDMIKGVRSGTGIDLAGACIGTVALDKVIVGAGCQPGDAVIGFTSSGIHSNGLSLARKALFERAGLRPDEVVPELGRSVGEELLEPTRMYVRGALALLRSEVRVKALANVTGGGFLNITRVDAPVGFRLTDLPPVPAIFKLIQQAGSVPDTEMYAAFNMGIGFAVTVDASDVDNALQICAGCDYEAVRIGEIIPGSHRVIVEPAGLVGQEGAYTPIK